MEKNQEFELTIEDLGNDGEGIGHIDGMAVFVKDAVPGDVIRVRIVKVKKQYAYGRVMEVLTPSPDRVEPRCLKARQCGGCTLQHLSYEAQLLYKWNKVKSCLERIGGLTNVDALMEPIVGMFTQEEAGKLSGAAKEKIMPNICPQGCWHYRNKAQFPVGQDAGGHVVTGFYAGRSHNIVPTTFCDIQAEVNGDILAKVTAFLERYQISVYNEEAHKGLVRHILTRVGFQTGEIMVCLIINGETLPHGEKLVEELSPINGMTSICLNMNRDKTNRILGDKCITLWGKDSITDYIGNVKYEISPMSFFQVNPVQTRVLYEKALEYADLHGDETVWDLYCGIGTISLFLAQRAKRVYGVELVSQAIEDARRNAEINGFTNTEFFVGKAEEILPNWYREHQSAGDAMLHPDVIVVDPPRKGCKEELLETIVQMAPKRMVYVSCDPATLARDLKYMTANGYQVERVCPVDQFGHSGHVEVVTCLQRVNS